MDITKLAALVGSLGVLITVLITMHRDNKRISREHEKQDQDHKRLSSEHGAITETITHRVEKEGAVLRGELQEVHRIQTTVKENVQLVAYDLRQQKEEQLRYRQSATSTQLNITEKIQDIQKIGDEMLRLQYTNEQVSRENIKLMEEKKFLKEQVHDLQQELDQYRGRYQDHDRGPTLGR